eukprot:jgi/Chlat1/8996/Chrsp94S08341
MGPKQRQEQEQEQQQEEDDYADEDFYDDDDFEQEQEGKEGEGDDAEDVVNGTLQAQQSNAPSTSAEERKENYSQPRQIFLQPVGERRMIMTKHRVPIMTTEQLAVAARRLERWRAVCEMVSMSEVGCDLIDVPPATVRELYESGRGPYANTAVASTQTHDDARTIEVQTDDINTRSTHAQCPDADTGAVAMPISTAGMKRPPISNGVAAAATSIIKRKEEVGRYPSGLAAFLQRAAANLETTFASRQPQGIPYTSSTSSAGAICSGGFMELPNNTLHVLGRVVRDVAYVNSKTLLVAYSRTLTEAISHGCLLVYNLAQMSTPTVLISEGEPSCCCACDNYAFAGMEEGSVSVWDIREPADVGHGRPTYSSDFDTDRNHRAKVVCVCATRVDSQRRGDRLALSDHGYRLTSLDVEGKLLVWSVESVSGSNAQADMGLSSDLGPTASAMRISDSSAGHALVGTDIGVCYRVAQYDSKNTHKKYVHSESPYLAVVRAIDTCPALSDIFLVGDESGRVSIFSQQSSTPLLTMPLSSEAIVGACFLPSRADIGFAADANGALHCVSLLDINGLSPMVLSENLGRVSDVGKPVRLAACRVSPSDNRSKYNQGDNHSVTLVYEDSTVVVRQLASGLLQRTSLSADEKLEDALRRQYGLS